MVGFHLFVYKVRENFRLRRPFARGTTPSTPHLQEIVVFPAKFGNLQIGASFSLLFFYGKTNRKPIKCAFDFRDQLVGIGNFVHWQHDGEKAIFYAPQYNEASMYRFCPDGTK